jgi:hypothetical protein
MEHAVAGARVHANTLESVKALAGYEHKTVSQLIKDALNQYAMRQCEILLVGLDSGVLNKVEGIALDKMRVYRDLATSFKANHDSIKA